MDVSSSRLADWASMTQITKAPIWSLSYNYDAIFWAAFCAAVERGGNAADMAWNKVVNGITNLEHLESWISNLSTVQPLAEEQVNASHYQ